MHSSNMRHKLICLLSWHCAHTPSLKPCQNKEGCSFMLRTYAFTHTHLLPPQTHTHNAGGKITYAAVYYHYHQQRGSEQKPSWILLLDAYHHRLSLRCLSGCHFGGGPAGVLTLRFHHPCPWPSPFVIVPRCLANDFLCTPFLFFCSQPFLSLL